jgi:hypothetical protein
MLILAVVQPAPTMRQSQVETQPIERHVHPYQCMRRQRRSLPSLRAYPGWDSSYTLNIGG